MPTCRGSSPSLLDGDHGCDRRAAGAELQWAFGAIDQHLHCVSAGRQAGYRDGHGVTGRSQRTAVEQARAGSGRRARWLPRQLQQHALPRLHGGDDSDGERRTWRRAERRDHADRGVTGRRTRCDRRIEDEGGNARGAPGAGMQHRAARRAIAAASPARSAGRRQDFPAASA